MCACTCVCVCVTCTYVCVPTYVCMYMYLCVRVIHTCMCMRVCVCVCISACLLSPGIDFVLVWEEDLTELKDENTEEKLSPAPDDSHRTWRERFLSSLQAAGILLEKVGKVSEGQRTGAQKLILACVPWLIIPRWTAPVL